MIYYILGKDASRLKPLLTDANVNSRIRLEGSYEKQSLPLIVHLARQGQVHMMDYLYQKGKYSYKDILKA